MPAPQAAPVGTFEVYPTAHPRGHYRWRLVADGLTLTSRAAFADPADATADATAVRDAATCAPVTQVDGLMSGAGG